MNKTQQLIGISQNGCEVYFDINKSHAITHFEKWPKLREAVTELIPELTLHDRVVDLEHDIGYEIGNCDLVETDDTDEIVYAKRPLRGQYTRFVKHRQSQPSSWVTLRLLKEPDGSYALYTAFIGKQTPSFPGGNFRTDESVDFWSRHALVWGSQKVVSGSETECCPWD